MRPAGIAVPTWHLLLLSLLSSFALGKDKPQLAVSKFEHPPVNLNYFEDSDVVLFHNIKEGSIYRSENAGAKWGRVKGIPSGKAGMLIMHPFDSHTAYVLSESTKHFKTEDRGENWDEFSSKLLPSLFRTELLTFHAEDPKRVIFNGMDCLGIFCEEEALYTTDGFHSIKELRRGTSGCWWAKASNEFTTGDKDFDQKRTMCIIKDPLSASKEEQRLVLSDSFFTKEGDSIQEFEPDMDTNKGVTGVVNLAVVKKYILVATAGFRSDEMALYVTDDTLKWHRAMFPSSDNHDHSHRINQGAYTVLESTNYSVQIDVMTSSPSKDKAMGVLFTSNSNGTYFTENVPYTNRNERGHVDFEKITGIQGIFLVNVVENGADVEKDSKSKTKITQISFDDGRTFEPIKAGDDRLHLHSVTEIDNIGRIFSSPAPGLVMGNGNTGKSLGDFKDASLYVSDDAGLNWKHALKGPHKYEFGDSGNILLAVRDSKQADVEELSYSLDHGKEWKTLKLPDDLKILPDLLTTTQDSTSLKFLLVGERKGTYYTIAIDFEGLHERTCGKDDLEDWHARVDTDGKSTCIMGHKQTFKRRRKTAQCFVKNEFKEPLPESVNCDCGDDDFECDYNFQRDPDDKSKCKMIGSVAVPDGVCKKGDKTFKGSSGWRLIPGNTCKRKDGKQKDDLVERECSEGDASPPPPASGEISHKKFDFDSSLKDFQKIYLDRGDTSTSDDETVIVRPAEQHGDGLQVENNIWISSNHGNDWKRILKDDKIEGIYTHPFFSDVVYFTTRKDNKVIYTIDRGHSFHSFKAPTKIGNTLPISFHPDKKDWLIWTGEECEKVDGKENCLQKASISTDRGDNWRTFQRYVSRCEFTGHSAYNYRPLEQIICLAHDKETPDSPDTVITSNDFFEKDEQKFDGEVTNFATMSEFIVLAKVNKDGELRAFASLDGKNFEKAHFPYNFHEPKDGKYTMLESSSHAVNLFVLASSGDDRHYGSIIKSNSNGTSYVLSAPHVNCNEQIYVDFEKIAGLEGVILINSVTNLGKKEKTKKLQTLISHNDGSEWGFLAPPAKDVDGKSYKCSSSKGESSCALHLHHYTERDDKSKTFAAATAVGLIFGTGNVGSSLGNSKDADTFMSPDGGVTWKNVKKGRWTWQYGDQGSIIVLVERAMPGSDVKTNLVSYSTDEGRTWKDYKFTDDKVTVLDITTVQSGTSRSFLLWCRSNGGKLFSVNLDFSGFADKPCKLEENGNSDYYLWSPKHPLQDDDCLFGHVATYLRKKTDRKCYNDHNIQRRHEYTNCKCSRRDYECAYNFELDNHGQCKLVDGFKPLSGKEWCEKNPDAKSWFEPTGYRRVPISTCAGGNELDKNSIEHPCDGYEADFNHRKPSGILVFFAVVIPIGLAAAVGWYVYRNWNGKFGQIRLGDSSSTFDSDQPWIKYPVIAVSAVVAVVAALPMLISTLFRSASGAYARVGAGRRGGSGHSWLSTGPRRFTTRDSFARGRGDYGVADEDEGELLGEESDEEV